MQSIQYRIRAAKREYGNEVEVYVGTNGHAILGNEDVEMGDYGYRTSKMSPEDAAWFKKAAPRYAMYSKRLSAADRLVRKLEREKNINAVTSKAEAHRKAGGAAGQIPIGQIPINVLIGGPTRRSIPNPYFLHAGDPALSYAGTPSAYNGDADLVKSIGDISKLLARHGVKLDTLYVGRTIRNQLMFVATSDNGKFTWQKTDTSRTVRGSNLFMNGVKVKYPALMSKLTQAQQDTMIKSTGVV